MQEKSQITSLRRINRLKIVASATCFFLCVVLKKTGLAKIVGYYKMKENVCVNEWPGVIVRKIEICKKRGFI
jgi:hypothetical protein